MSYINTIKKKVLESLNLKDEDNRERWRNQVDVYVSAKEKMSNPTPSLILEAAAEIGLMSCLEYKGKKYPTRQIQLFDDTDGIEFTVMIASEELCEAYGNPEEVEWDEKAQTLDCYIYFYVEPEAMFKSAEEIAEKYLDEPFELLTEIF